MKSKTYIAILVTFVVSGAWPGYAMEDNNYKLHTLSQLDNVVGASQGWYFKVYEGIQGPKYNPMVDFPEKTVTVCYGNRNIKEICNKIRTKNSDNTYYEYASVDNVEIIKLNRGKKPKYGIKLVASLPFTSDILRSISIYTFDNNAIKNSTPDISVTLDGDYMVMDKIGNTKSSGFIVATHIWGDGETHYSLHKFHVRVYKFDNMSNYKLIGDYITKKKYQSVDSDIEDEHQVIHGEINNIYKYYKAK